MAVSSELSSLYNIDLSASILGSSVLFKMFSSSVNRGWNYKSSTSFINSSLLIIDFN